MPYNHKLDTMCLSINYIKTIKANGLFLSKSKLFCDWDSLLYKLKFLSVVLNSVVGKKKPMVRLLPSLVVLVSNQAYTQWHGHPSAWAMVQLKPASCRAPALPTDAWFFLDFNKFKMLFKQSTGSMASWDITEFTQILKSYVLNISISIYPRHIKLIAFKPNSWSSQ